MQLSYQNTPEVIGHYLAQKIKAQGVTSVLDVFAGDGGNSIQFALEGVERVQAFEEHYTRASLSFHNSKLYRTGDNLRIDCQDFF